MSEPTNRAEAQRRRPWRPIYYAPIVAFAALSVVLAWGLTRDPSAIPTPLIGKPVPQFALSPVKGRLLGLSSADLVGEPSIVNVFASWCVECRIEHPLIMQMKARAVAPIHGLNYKDHPDDAARWLNTFGDPYTRTGADLDGRVAIDWGVYGVPETFVIGADGRIAFKHIGPLTAEVVERTIIPLIDSLKQSQPQAHKQSSTEVSLARDRSADNQPTETEKQK
ncbi:MAG: DsbE family thiol:disulfide interchange protein [Roseiarcus sp.]|jgi:cytochrome c biogenesis protein CcmG/thiol:disulfide interchange protein DsbE